MLDLLLEPFSYDYMLKAISVGYSYRSWWDL